MKWMKKLLALHAHFYQPHTQDLWLGDYIEDSWGKKTRSLTKACYGANSASRIIGADGRIEQIVNNYRYLSFSFDPQLLETLKLSAPNVYHRILQGDKLSMADQEGFGNALAQPYSHSILPLLSAKEQKLQIDWGISSFQQHFGRDPLGMWLPEMGVSFPTIDFLIEASGSNSSS
jgi:alpha-amylase/alpha-mannosidase (GH57 family)